jgi:hypothetical protein
MSWNKQNFWILTATMEKGSKTAVISTRHLGLEKPQKYQLIDLFQVTPSKSKLHRQLELIKGDVSEITPRDTVTLEIELTPNRMYNASVKAEALVFKDPFRGSFATVESVAARATKKSKKLKLDWNSYRSPPKLVYNNYSKRFKLTLPPNTEAFAKDQLSWALFGLENKAKNLSDNILDLVADPSESIFGQGADNQQQQQQDREEAREEAKPAVNIPNETVGNLNVTDMEEFQDASEISFLNPNDLNLPPTPKPPKTSKRAAEEEESVQWGFQNKTNKPRVFTGEVRDPTKDTMYYVDENQTDEALQMSQARFVVQASENGTGFIEREISDIFDFRQIYTALLSLLEEASQRLNLPSNVLTIERIPNTSKFVFVSKLLMQPLIPPMQMSFKMAPNTQKILGFGHNAHFFGIDTFKSEPYYFTQSEVEIDSQKDITKHYSVADALANLPPTTAVVLNSYHESNTVYSNSASNTLLCYITSGGKLISTPSFEFSGYTNFLTCEFFNQRAESTVTWDEPTIFKFIFQRI